MMKRHSALRVWFIGIVIAFALLLGIVRVFYPERSMTYSGPRALLDAGFALGLLAFVLLLANALGVRILSWLKFEGLTHLEQTVFGIAIGLGVIAYGVLALGLGGILKPWTILVWLILVGFFIKREWIVIVGNTRNIVLEAGRDWQGLGVGKKIVLVLGGLILFMTLIQALAPPWDYDGLMYHLKGPEIFLMNGRILPLPDIWGANGPFTIEMLFLLGLGFESDVFAKLIHLTFAVLLVIGTYTFGRRYIKPHGGWVSAVILLGIPIFPLWASLAYVDIAWAFYEFLAVYALICWVNSKQRSELILSGLVMGLALGTKYLALVGVPILGLTVLWFSRRASLKTILLQVSLFGSTALVVGSPWYLKNLFLTGNPVYPLYFGGIGWNADRVNWLMLYLRSFGAGHGVWDYLLLPWNLYAQHTRFATFKGSIEMMSLLFVLVLLWPMMSRSKNLGCLAIITLLRSAAWAFGSQQTRLLLPVFPGLSLLTGSVLVGSRIYLGRKQIRILTAGLLAGVLIATLIYSVIYFVTVQPLPVVLGIESKDAFLRRSVADYPAKQYLQNVLSQDSRVLFMWDGQGYYCDERCVPDTEHNRWTRLTESSANISSLASDLRDMGITHLLFSIEDAAFILQHDSTYQHLQATVFFLDKFRQACTREIYSDHSVNLFEVTCK